MALKPLDQSGKEDAVRRLCHDDSPDITRYRTFLGLYQIKTCLETPQTRYITIANSWFQSHREFWDCVQKLQDDSDTRTKQELLDGLPATFTPKDRYRALRAATQMGFMVDCEAQEGLALGGRPASDLPLRWGETESLTEFLKRAFPDTSSSLQPNIKIGKLKAWKMAKRYNVRFVATSDLAQHLLYDESARTVKIFHQTSWLKAHLRYIESKNQNAGFEEAAKLGSFPHQLLLETLFTISHVLLPLFTDEKSNDYALRLIKEYEFDPDIAVWDNYNPNPPGDFEYKYWNHRLAVLKGIVANPPPANKLIAWFERHTSERNALTVAVLGLFLAALFGFLSFAVGVAQLVVSIRAWKHPAPQPPGNN